MAWEQRNFPPNKVVVLIRFKMADEVHSPAKKRRRTDKTGSDHRDKPESKRQLANQTGEIKKITCTCTIHWSISNNSVLISRTS